MRTSEQINEIATAMAIAQGAIKPAVKDATNPAFRSKYADLSAIWEAIRGPLATNKIAVWQEAELTEAGVAVTTRLAHASGQWVEFGPLTVPCAKRDAHGVGSATTYAKRYAIAAVVGVVSDDDDDGNAASQKTTTAVAAPVKPEGFDAWRIDLEATADNGRDALNKMWSASRVECRDYLRMIDPTAIDKLGEKAKKANVAVGA